ncbi:hypothetical protein J6590_106628 [Homalodisca vitripennis]|nr:hypothetical protein J6590_106628 [Homalodisca vitripennis]
MVDIAEMYGADRRLAQVKLNESLMFEIELAKLEIIMLELAHTPVDFTALDLFTVNCAFITDVRKRFVNELQLAKDFA